MSSAAEFVVSASGSASVVVAAVVGASVGGTLVGACKTAVAVEIVGYFPVVEEVVGRETIGWEANGGSPPLTIAAL